MFMLGSKVVLRKLYWKCHFYEPTGHSEHVPTKDKIAISKRSKYLKDGAELGVYQAREGKSFETFTFQKA